MRLEIVMLFYALSVYYFVFVFSCIELNKNPVDGFSAGLIDDNDIYRWEVMVIGPPDTYLYVGFNCGLKI